MGIREKATSFTDLSAWQESHKLALSVYRLCNTLPATENYGLSSQMRRAAVSVTSNIAEGFGRYGKKEKALFYNHSRSSLIELQNQLLLAKDVGYISDAKYLLVNDQAVVAHRLISGLIKSQKPRLQTPNPNSYV